MSADADDLIDGLVSRIGQLRSCCCPSRDAFECFSIRYGRFTCDVEPCQCACHDEMEEEW